MGSTVKTVKIEAKEYTLKIVSDIECCKVEIEVDNSCVELSDEDAIELAIHIISTLDPNRIKAVDG